MKRASVIMVDYTKCTGCMSCMLACSFAHEGVFSLTSSRIWIHKDEAKATFVPTICESCSHMPCLHVCPVSAISYDEELGMPIIDEKTCIGCGLCEEACPYYGVKVDFEARKAFKCDLCGGDPECIKVCDVGAIELVPMTRENMRKKDQLALARINILEQEVTTNER